MQEIVSRKLWIYASVRLPEIEREQDFEQIMGRLKLFH